MAEAKTSQQETQVKENVESTDASSKAPAEEEEMTSVTSATVNSCATGSTVPLGPAQRENHSLPVVSDDIAELQKDSPAVSAETVEEQDPEQATVTLLAMQNNTTQQLTVPELNQTETDAMHPETQTVHPETESQNEPVDEKCPTAEMETDGNHAQEIESEKQEPNSEHQLSSAAATPERELPEVTESSKPKAASVPASRQPRVSRTVPGASTIRTRRKKADAEIKAEEAELTVAEEFAIKTESSDTESESKGRIKSGRGRGRAWVRRPLKEPKAEPVIEEFPSVRGRRGQSSSGHRMTRAAAAGLKTVEFLQLPRQPKKRRRGGGEDADDELNTKKTRDEQEEEGEEEEEETSGCEEDVPAAPPEKMTRPSPKGRGRGRGKRGRVGGVGTRAESSVPSHESSPMIEEGEEMKKRKRKDSDATDNEEPPAAKDATPTKKRRGRPKKKSKEDVTPTHSFSSDTPTLQSPSIKQEPEEEMDTANDPSSSSASEPVKHPEQIAQLLQLSENADTGDMNDTVPSAATKSSKNKGATGHETTPTTLPVAHGDVNATKETKATPDADKTQETTAAADVNTAVSSGEPAAAKDTTKQQSVTSSTSSSTPASSQAPPTSVPIDTPYPFSRYPLEDQGYPHSYPPIPPHSFLPPSYPPFSAPPYPAFMIPTSPHFSPYPPPPQDCLPPPAIYHFSEDPFNRYPTQSTASSSSVSQANNEKVSSPSVEPPMTTPTNQPHPTTPTISTSVTHIGLPHPLTYTPSHIAPPTHHPGYPLAPYGPPMLVPPDWNITHQISAPGAPPTQPPAPPPPPPPAPPAAVKAKESRFPISFLPSEETQSTGNPVDCPECGRHFKNNKALNGHMRLHGGFDWTRRVCRPYVVGATKKEEDLVKSERERKNDSIDDSRARHVHHKETRPTVSKVEVQTKNKEKENRHSATLDDLCRAAEELERIERDNLKPRPSPLILPHERRITSFSPPYTPPPILSPARSLVLLSNSTVNSGGPIPTPSKIWPQRKGSDTKGIRDLEEPFEPKINVGTDFQAEVPECTQDEPLRPEGLMVWEPMNGLSQEDEDTIDGYLELACSPAVPHGGRNKELALHLLKQVNGSVKEAVRMLVMGKSLLIPGHEMTDYNYTGSKRWSAKERQQFRRAWRVHRKQFNMLQSSIESKSLSDVIEYYYFWKKYCPDEYRGRNRHASDEILSEEDEILLRPPSSGSNSSDSNDADQQPLDDSAHINGTLSSSKLSALSVSSSSSCSKSHSNSQRTKLVGAGGSSVGPSEVARDISRGFSSHSFGHVPIQEHRCKYPGCNQVYTSIFALNGHIRIHGGSWYPKKLDVENMKESSPPTERENKREEEIRKHQLEIAKTMVMELPQPRSPAYSLGTLTPSPKASPNRSKSSLVKSKKACSSSPADREGFYPCNRCGRVFHKVKSRSAHMKSHIIKQVH